MQARFARNAVVLGLLSALGPFAIDMYLPSLPRVADSFGVGYDGALLSMTAFFVTFALGQLIYGPSSDIFGRRRPLLIGTAIFALASVGCAYATTIEQLVVFRMLQGLGGAAGGVIARAIVHDLHRGVEETRLLSLLMLVFGVSPIFAPLIGNGVIAISSWRGVFWVVGAIGLACLVLIALYVPETRSREARAGASIGHVLRACKVLFADRRFVGLTLVSSFSFAGFLVYLSQSPLVLPHQYHQSPLEYSLAFSLNAVAFFAVLPLNARLAQRFGLARLIRPAALGYAAVMLLALAAAAAGFDQFVVVACLLFVGYGLLGMILPVTSVVALEAHGEIAGTAASLMSALQLLTGAIMAGVSGAIADGGVVRMLAAIAGCATVAAVAALTLERPQAPSASLISGATISMPGSSAL